MLKKIFLLLVVLVGLGLIFRPTKSEGWPVHPVDYSEKKPVVKTPVAPVQAPVQPSHLTVLTNEWRAQNNLPALVESPLLNKSAELKCLDMQAKNYWSHNSPDGTLPWAWFKQVDYSYVYAGENLAKQFVTAEGAIKGWKESPTHNENLLKPEYTEVGFATCEGPQRHLVVQHLGKPYRK